MYKFSIAVFCGAVALLSGVSSVVAADKELHWRDDPSTLRHPGSYIGGGSGYALSYSWLSKNEDHSGIDAGPLHGWHSFIRVGDAFAEWFAVGFQISISSTHHDNVKSGAFALFLDTTFYPWKGLALRPALGIGFGYTQGEEDYEIGFGGPGALGLSVAYEFRVSRLFTITPVVQTYWITKNEKEDYDAMVFLIGLEFTKWFVTATG